MRKITIIYDGRAYTYKWLKTMMWAKDAFKERQVKVEYISMFSYLPGIKYCGKQLEMLMEKNKRYDIVMLAFHHSTTWLGSCSSEERCLVLEKIRDKCNMLVWLDTADSTGCCLFDVMPYVDFYLKKQVLKDLALYEKPMYGSRIFTDYYHQQLHIEDDNIKRPYPLLAKEYENKIKVSWNVGLGDLYASKYQLRCNFKTITPPSSSMCLEKSLDIHYRGSSYSPLAGYQREVCSKYIANLKDKTHPDGSKSIPHDEYVKEIASAKSILSPFGWGEICTRDFESFVYGATLLKPSMEHCITYPDVYIPNETYVPIKWDFSNMDSVVSGIDSLLYKEIAKKGKENYYRHIVTDEAKRLFANHIIEILEL